MAAVLIPDLVQFLKVATHQQVQLAETNAHRMLRRRRGLVPGTKDPDLLARTKGPRKDAGEPDEDVASRRRGRRDRIR